MPRLDEAGRDTELARFLHGRGRLDRKTLESLLTDARRGRPEGGTLARAIVQRGILSESEVEASLQQLAAGAAYPARPSGRFEAVPPPSSGSLPGVPGPGHRPSGSYQATGSGVANSLAGPKSGRMQRSSGRFGALMQGLTLGAYRVLEPLGAGSMGQVFLAEHVETGGRYAVKTLLSTADPGFIARFLREGEAQAKVDSHPNVLRVHAMGEARGLHYLITELASGGDLKEALRKQERLPAEGAARLARDLARGLAHMHAQGVLHRDLKPANILFDANGVAKLADFGLARFEGAQSLTRTGDLVGTPVYMPPEQAMGLRDQVGPASDVYGLAAIIYHCLAGRPPFEGATTIEVVDKLTNQQAPPLTSLAPDTPSRLAQLVHAGLAKDAAQRPTAAAWAQELDAFLTPPTETKTPGAASARGPLPVLIAGAVLSLLLALGVVGALVLRGQPPEDLSAAAGAGSTPAAAGSRDTTPAPEASPAPTPPSPGLVWPVGVERRYLLDLRMHGEFPTMGWTAMMANGQSQQTMRFQRAYGLVLWHQPLADDEEAVVDTSAPSDTSLEDEEGEEDEEWEHDHDDWDLGDGGEPAPEPGVIRLRARIESFALNWVALGMSKAFDSREVAQDEDGRRYGQVVGQEFTLGMRSSGEVVWVRGTEAIQQSIYRGGQQEPSDARPNPMAGMRTRMTYHVPELVGSVMRQTLNTFFHVLQADGPLEDGQTYGRLLPAPWSVGSGWGMGRGRERNQLAAPSIPCQVTVRGSREGTFALTWSGDNQDLVAEALAQGEVLLHRKARGRASIDQGALLRSELQRDSFSGEFQVESSWGGDGSPQVRRIKGEQEGRLELVLD